MATVIKVRCNKCEQTFSMISTQRKFVNGAPIGISCKDIQSFYPKAKGCDQALVFIRKQGHREIQDSDVSLEKIQDDLERTKTGSEETGNSGQ